jgi:predicted  nucleic acid-binding Zn-ribbon protein
MLFVKDYFMCGHMMCYNIAIKFKHCILCGNNKLKYVMNNINEWWSCFK